MSDVQEPSSAPVEKAVQPQVFLSHSSQDEPTVLRLRRGLEDLGIRVWVDGRELVPGDGLERADRQGVETCDAFVALLSQAALESKWVAQEVQWALARRQRHPDYPVVPILVPPVGPVTVTPLFGEQPLAILLDEGEVDAVLGEVLQALGLEARREKGETFVVPSEPVADLRVELSHCEMRHADGVRRARAEARVVFEPVDRRQRTVWGHRFWLEAPLGPIEAGELAWYLRSFHRWTSPVFEERARGIEARLPKWGRALWRALDVDAAREPVAAWEALAGGTIPRRLTLLVERPPVESDREDEAAADGDPTESGATSHSTTDASPAAAAEAATELLALPWELCRDAQGYLFEGANAVRVRRALPQRRALDALVTEPPIRVLLVSPRPEDESAAYIDHRISARPVVEALVPLGEQVELEVLEPPTFPALTAKLEEARRAGRPFHVLHFDGHGVYDRRHGLGALCFEDPEDADKLQDRRTAAVDAPTLAAALREHRVPLVFLEACESAQAKEAPTASVAGALLEGGVASVVAMSHAVLVETARRFVAAFYEALMKGQRVGEAMLAGQRVLQGDKRRGKTMGGDLTLEDWFVPVLYQEPNQDPPLVMRLPADTTREVTLRRLENVLQPLPAAPAHEFQGRSRELLALERLLLRTRHAAILGEGGEGKTTLAAELARWMVLSRRAEKVAFVAFDQLADPRAFLHVLGDQLVPGFSTEAAKGGGDGKAAFQLLERTLKERRTLLVLDNMETILPPPAGVDDPTHEPELLAEILQAAHRLSRTGNTRLLFTTREPLSAPFNSHHVRIGRLARDEAIALVARALGETGDRPPAADPGESDDEVEQLVDAAGRHARSLVLLAGEVRSTGVKGATARIAEIMRSLQERYPDDRERSLLASAELSLRRLPPATRALLPRLAPFQGGGFLGTIAHVLELGDDRHTHIAFAEQLAGVGLAELQIPPGYLRFHPALLPAVSREQSEADSAAALSAWCEATLGMIYALYEQKFQNARLAATLTLLDLPNLLAGAEASFAETATAEEVVDVATSLEGLLAQLGRPRALARASALREAAAAGLGEWGRARFEAERAHVERLLEAGQAAEADAQARALLTRCDAAGEEAYPGAAYDMAVAHLQLGRTNERIGQAGDALVLLRAARRRFQVLAAEGHQDAARMGSACLTEQGDCLVALGKLEEAAAAYEQAIGEAEGLEARRAVAVAKGQLGTVRLLQRRYPEALAAWDEARRTFEELGEPRSIATAWHQLGWVHHRAGQPGEAEQAYQCSLRLTIQEGNRAGQAATLNQLSLLYASQERLEEAVDLGRQAADAYAALGNRANEGRVRNNLALRLLTLRRHDEARQELERAFECKAPFGHAAEPWKTFDLLHDLEQGAGNPEAAARARDQAVASYLAYRRDGGENLSGGGRIFAATRQALATGTQSELLEQLAQLEAKLDLPAYLKPLLPKLQAILQDDRSPTLAADPALDYDDAAELQLLLEDLAAPKDDGSGVSDSEASDS